MRRQERTIEEAGEGTVFPIAVADNVTFVGPVDGRATTAVTRRYVELGATIGVRILGAKNRALNFSIAHLHDEVHRYGTSDCSPRSSTRATQPSA